MGGTRRRKNGQHHRLWLYKTAQSPRRHLFLKSAFPPTKDETKAHVSAPLVFGESSSREYYAAPSILNISAMSNGALSDPAIEALLMGAAASGVWLNTGEGGLSPFHQTAACDSVFQIGTEKYGVRDFDGNLDIEKIAGLAAIPRVKVSETKLPQEAKPRKGGILPAEKVTDLIATTRGISPGEDSISPNRHPEVAEADSLLDLIDRVRLASGKPVGIKLVLGQTAWLGSFCDAIHARGPTSAPDFVTSDSADGGTGAAPHSLMDNMGRAVASSLPMVDNKLTSADLRERIKLIASGKVINRAGVAAALRLGADLVCSARGFMFSLRCIQALQCKENTCPTGITTHDPKLQKGLVPAVKADRVANYAISMREEVELVAHSCGVLNTQALSRRHAYVIDDQGQPSPLDTKLSP